MAGVKLYPNQQSIVIFKREDSELFAQFDMDALQKAMQELDGAALKIWLYLVKNRDRFEFALSPKAMEEWGLKKDSYYRGKKVLEEKGYLVEGKDGLEFYDMPKEKVERIQAFYGF